MDDEEGARFQITPEKKMEKHNIELEIKSLFQCLYTRKMMIINGRNQNSQKRIDTANINGIKTRENAYDDIDAIGSLRKIGERITLILIMYRIAKIGPIHCLIVASPNPNPQSILKLV